MDQSYKEEHELFVSGSNGTSIREILMLTMLTTSSSIIVTALKHICSSVLLLNITAKTNDWFSGTVQALLICSPLTLGATVLNAHIELLFFVTIVGAVISGIVMSKLPSTTDVGKSPLNSAYLTHYRSHLLLDTSISILAVDFPIYPRRLAKTDLYGFGYMDVGVGCFIVAAGIISPEARRKPVGSKFKHIKSAFTSSTVMILLGVVRAVSIWITNYQVHVTEYGVHWNFFITMAAVKVLCSSLLSLVTLKKACLLSGALVLLYQRLLISHGLTQFLLETQREGFFQENKEGFLSLIGYCFLYLASAQVGNFIFSSKSDKHVALGLSALAVASYLSMVFCQQLIQPTSRRLMNMAYIFWMLLPWSSECALLRGINRNGMLHFLLANLLTGAINFTTDTIHAPVFQAFVIINLYVAVLSLTALFLHRNNMKMDFSTFRFKKE